MYWHALTILCDDNATPREILTVYQLFMAFCSAKLPSRASRYNNFAHIFCRKPSGRTRRRPFFLNNSSMDYGPSSPLDVLMLSLVCPWEFQALWKTPSPALRIGCSSGFTSGNVGNTPESVEQLMFPVKLAIWLVYPCFGHRNLNSGSSRLVPLHIQGHHTTGVFTLPSCRGFPESPVADDTTKRST